MEGIEENVERNQKGSYIGKIYLLYREDNNYAILILLIRIK